jgi:serine phosphatase RsbU (regulator of sigma subunit)
LNTRRLKEQNIRLENIIHERTKTIVDQKAEIEHKNQEITDSINYAKRIQEAILPPIHEIVKTWDNSFVFYQPKDIVSGDFYWFNKINENEFLIAVADCTGHGVPGGFMSMICSDKLNDAAKQTANPAEILFTANNNIKKTLRQGQSEGGSKDGMEIALLHVNTKSKKVRYSGANRPLWLLKNLQTDIEEIKPTKASIASFTEYDFEYGLHEFELQQGDQLYLTSDGYPDQFGGPDGKKFMSKNMKKLILQHKHESMLEQGNCIKKHIEDWMRGFEQVDDLLVIGIRL